MLSVQRFWILVIHTVVWQHNLRFFGGILLLQISFWLCQWKRIFKTSPYMVEIQANVWCLLFPLRCVIIQNNAQCQQLSISPSDSNKLVSHILPTVTVWWPNILPMLMHVWQCDCAQLPCLSNGVLQPIQVSRFFVNAASPPTFDATIVFVRVCSPSENKLANTRLLLFHVYYKPLQQTTTENTSWQTDLSGNFYTNALHSSKSVTGWIISYGQAHLNQSHRSAQSGSSFHWKIGRKIKGTPCNALALYPWSQEFKLCPADG